MLTIKSDDVKGRADAYKAIIHGEKIENANVPESFKVLVRELNALCLNIDLVSKPRSTMAPLKTETIEDRDPNGVKDALETVVSEPSTIEASEDKLNTATTNE